MNLDDDKGKYGKAVFRRERVFHKHKCIQFIARVPTDQVGVAVGPWCALELNTVPPGDIK